MSMKSSCNTVTQIKSSELRQLYGLNRSPAKCPISDCNQILFPSALLSHYLISHSIDQKIQMREVFEDERLILTVHANQCPFGKNVCLGALAYAGTYGMKESVPAKRPVSFPSMGLSGTFNYLSDHLPVLIMMCQTTWNSLLQSKSLQRDTKVNDPNNRIYVIWFVSSGCTKNIHVTVTIYNKLQSQSRSGIRLVRDFSHTQNIDNFLSTDMNYLLLTSTDIEKLSDPKDKRLHMEIILHENPTLLKTFFFYEK